MSRGRIWGAALAWLLGLYVLPLAHNVGHRNDHSHGASPARHSHSHEAEHSHPHPHPTGDKVPLESDHGNGSVLHFAAAALAIHGVDLPQAGPLALIPPAPSPRMAPSVPVRIVLVRGPPAIDLL